MYRSSVSRNLLAAVSAASLLAVGCGGTVTSDEKAPAQVRQAVKNGASQVAGGRDHTLAVRPSDGTVWAWGANTYGQLGNGTTSASTVAHPTPTQVQGLTGTFTSVTAGEMTSLALRNDGTVWAWGYNGLGALGDNTTTNRSTPVQVQGLPATAPVKAISMDDGGHHVLALLSNGTVWAWGFNQYGQTGSGTPTNQKLPVQVQIPPNPETNDSTVIAIAAGMHHSLAVRSDGTVWAWGRNSSGELGNTNVPIAAQSYSTQPVKVMNLPKPAVDVAASLAASFVLLSDVNEAGERGPLDGTVYSFGSNSLHKLGRGTLVNGTWTGSGTLPDKVDQLAGVTRLDASWGNGLAVTSDGQLWTWGDTYAGALGNGVYEPNQMMRLGLSAGSNAQVSAGRSFCLVMPETGTLWTWGYNNSGQLGRTTSTWYTNTPALVTF